jgi:hypothetical protein
VDGIVEFLQGLFDKVPPSLYRFEDLKDHESATNSILRETEKFSASHGLTVMNLTPNENLPELPTSSGFKYDDQVPAFYCALLRGEDVKIVLVKASENVIAFGLVESPKDGEVEIEIIDVATEWRRSAGRKTLLELEGQTFEVGVAHVLVTHLVRSANSGKIKTNASNKESRYVFKSVGFKGYSNEDPCLLRFIND